jgi:serine/threonine protein kinase
MSLLSELKNLPWLRCVAIQTANESIHQMEFIIL